MKHLTTIALSSAAILTLGLQAAHAESQLGAFDPAAHMPAPAMDTAPATAPSVVDNRVRGGRLSAMDLETGVSSPGGDGTSAEFARLSTAEDNAAETSGPASVADCDYAQETLFGKLSVVNPNIGC